MFAQKCNQPHGIVLDKCKFCEPEKYLKFGDEYRLRENDIVVNSTGTGTLGRVGLFRAEYLRPYGYESIVPDSHVMIVRANEKIVSPYLYLYMKQGWVYQWINDNANGSTNQKELYPQTLVELLVPLPPLVIQRAIVARLEKELGEADKLAAKFKRVAELADNAFKAELDETFKALEDNSRRDAETRRVRLGDVCKVLTDGDWIESKDQSETGIRLIQTGNVGNGVFERKDNRARYISVATFAKLNCTEIYCGDILISRLPEPVGRACIVEDVGCRMITAVDCSIVRFKDTIEPKFFIHYSQSSKYRSQISSQLTGTTRARISRKHLSSVLIACPPISTQRAIIAKLDAAKERCEKLKAAAMRGLAAAENLRKAILAEAFEQ